MSHALLTPTTNTLLQSHPTLTTRNSGFTYTVARSETGGYTYSVTDGSGTLALPIRWSFGAKSQTWVLEYNGKLYESRMSYYPAINGLDLTMGDQDTHPTNLVEAMGRELSAGEARTCFECHATHAISDDQIQKDSLTPGIQCAHCHTGTAEHLEAVSHQKVDVIPPKLAKITSEDMSTFCGQCHRSFADVVRNRLFGQINVRFQPYRLVKSKCYDGSDARISCVACHDPHREVVRDDSTYDSQCLACHAGPKTTPAAAAKAMAKACPKASSGCVTCHMPKIELIGGHQTFTDHYIRIVKANETYPE